MTSSALRKKWKRFNLRGTLFLVFLGAFFVFSGLYALDLWRAGREARAFEDLAARVEEQAEKQAEAAAPTSGQEQETLSLPSEREYLVPVPEEELSAARLAAYGALREENPDFCGWLSIPGTRLD